MSAGIEPVSLANKVINLYETYPLKEGWMNEIDGYIDMCLVIRGGSKGEVYDGPEHHCYVSLEIEKGQLSGYFAYWTEVQGMPCEKGIHFDSLETLEGISDVEHFTNKVLSDLKDAATEFYQLIEDEPL
jgi:hypothetical protein